MGAFVPQFAWICGGENKLLQPFYLSYSPIVETQKRSKGSVGLESEEPIFDYTNRVIILKNIKGHFNMASGDIINDFLAFTISLTNQPEEFNVQEGGAGTIPVGSIKKSVEDLEAQAEGYIQKDQTNEFQ